VDEEQVDSLEDLTLAIELYNALIGLERYKEAHVLFRDRLRDPMVYQLSASRPCIELLNMLFPDRVGELPRLQGAGAQSFALNVLALAYELSGQPGRAVPIRSFTRTRATCWHRSSAMPMIAPRRSRRRRRLVAWRGAMPHPLLTIGGCERQEHTSRFWAWRGLPT